MHGFAGGEEAVQINTASRVGHHGMTRNV
jgi:hypothetical protein